MTDVKKMPIKDISFISGNPNKLSEVKAILGETVLLKSKPLELVEIQGSIEEIALDKCRRACDIVRSRLGGFSSSAAKIFYVSI